MRGWALILMMAMTTMAQAAQLSIERIFDGSSLSGPAPIKLKASPDGTRVTFLRAKAEDQNTFDLWEYNVKSNSMHLLVDSRLLQPANEQLSDAEKARRERARIAGRHGIVDYQWSPDGKTLLFPLAGKLYVYDLAAFGARAPRELNSGGEAIDPKISPQGH